MKKLKEIVNSAWNNRELLKNDNTQNVIPTVIDMLDKDIIPEHSIVTPYSYTKNFLADNFQLSCTLIVGKQKKSTNLKTSLNDTLREYDVSSLKYLLCE